MKAIKKKTDANFLLFVANCGKILFYTLIILIYFFKYETIVRFDVYACLDCNCWKRITVDCWDSLYLVFMKQNFKRLDKPSENLWLCIAVDFGCSLAGNGTSIWHCFGPKANPLGWQMIAPYPMMSSVHFQIG